MKTYDQAIRSFMLLLAAERTASRKLDPGAVDAVMHSAGQAAIKGGPQASQMLSTLLNDVLTFDPDNKTANVELAQLSLHETPPDYSTAADLMERGGAPDAEVAGKLPRRSKKTSLELGLPETPKRPAPLPKKPKPERKGLPAGSKKRKHARGSHQEVGGPLSRRCSRASSTRACCSKRRSRIPSWCVSTKIPRSTRFRCSFFSCSRIQPAARTGAAAQPLSWSRAPSPPITCLRKIRIFANLNLAPDELVLYEQVYKLLDSRMVKPDLVSISPRADRGSGGAAAAAQSRFRA